jgi:Tfp pilus assembly protein PilF
MILYIIILLTLGLVALLIDWSALGKRFQRTGRRITAHATSTVASAARMDFLSGAGEELAAAASGAAPTTLPVAAPLGVMTGTVIPGTATETAPPKRRVDDKTQREIEENLTMADAHFRKGEIKAAEELYVKVAALDPACAKAYSRLGIIYLEHEDNLGDAEAAFRQALKIEPNNGYILNNLGLVLYHQDKYTDAIRNFEQAVRQDELNAARHANLGMAYLAIRQYAKAESSFKKALKLEPNEAEYKDLLNEAIEKKKAHKSMARR